ncbi:MAG: hypothetical protein ABEH47_08320 [Haloferacaceae archaeon]
MADTSGPDASGDSPGAADAVDDADGPPPRPPIEPQAVNYEHAAFVLLGVALTLVVVLSVL